MIKRHERHSKFTRIAHMGLALAIISQLLTSLVMVPPSPPNDGSILYEIHEYGGFVAFTFMLLFWIVLTTRRIGTAPGKLFPWFSTRGFIAVWEDVKSHSRSLVRLRLPSYDENGPLASAIHGLGLLLMTVMAATGTLYYFINSGDPDAGGLVGVLMLVHTTLANLVWAYLIGHMTLAVVHHFTDNLSLTEMWSLRGKATHASQAPNP